MKFLKKLSFFKKNGNRYVENDKIVKYLENKYKLTYDECTKFIDYVKNYRTLNKKDDSFLSKILNILTFKNYRYKFKQIKEINDKNKLTIISNYIKLIIEIVIDLFIGMCSIIITFSIMMLIIISLYKDKLLFLYDENLIIESRLSSISLLIYFLIMVLVMSAFKEIYKLNKSYSYITRIKFKLNKIEYYKLLLKNDDFINEIIEFEYQTYKNKKSN